ncbi:MAG TPA: VirB8/TrbF family protein [Novosphingobium sp.]|nr:VirB8/TrbF family protein [Novosphingobium sp.]
MNDMSDEELKRYYDEAGSWSADRTQALVASRRLAWILAGVATGVAALEALALAALAPLKTVEPYTLLVDRQTGNVQALKPLEQQAITPDDALVRSFLAQYVMARESFDINSLKGDYRRVALWSAEDARDRYLAAMQASNPVSPLATLPRQALVEAEVRSISSLSADTALVRFATTRTDPGGKRQDAQTWAAVIRYRFSAASMSASDRLLNPLGFQVLRYRRDAEMVMPAPQPSPGPDGQQGQVQPNPSAVSGAAMGPVQARPAPARAQGPQP